MRPTINEQLDGAQRLLDLVGADEGLSAASRELLRNAGRLLHRVGTSWAATLPFLIADNATMTELLGRFAALVPGLSVPAQVDTADVASVSGRNVELRALLARVIRELPRTPAGVSARADIGEYLLRRVELDPT